MFGCIRLGRKVVGEFVPRARRFVALVSALIIGLAAPASEAARGSLIRDAEIEDTIRAYAAPVFRVAGLDAAAVRVFLINDPELNAFVAGGQNLFMFTGLLTASDTPNQTIGVIAHETAHIAGGHIARGAGAMQSASTAALVGILMGIAAAIGGRGDAGMAAAIGSMTTAGGYMAQFSRTQEAAADQAAATYLERTGQSARGYLEILKKLADNELLTQSRQASYARSHPMSRERVAFLSEHVEKSKFSDAPINPVLRDRHLRMVAKLRGFLDPPGRTFRHYPEGDTSLYARYARAIAHHRAGDEAKSIAAIDELIARHPLDPYFHELRGQVLMERGRVAESLPSFARARELKPDNPLLATLQGQALIAADDPALIKTAIEALEWSVRRDATDSGAWHSLSVAYGRSDRFGDAALASAEKSMLTGDFVGARDQSKRAQTRLRQGSPGWLRAQDIESEAQRLVRLQRGGG